MRAISALGGPAPTITPAPGEGEDLGLLGLIQQSLQNAQAIKQGGPAGKQVRVIRSGVVPTKLIIASLGCCRCSWPNPAAVHRLRSQQHWWQFRRPLRRIGEGRPLSVPVNMVSHLLLSSLFLRTSLHGILELIAGRCSMTAVDCLLCVSHFEVLVVVLYSVLVLTSPWLFLPVVSPSIFTRLFRLR